jgi:hypothetical protein
VRQLDTPLQITEKPIEIHPETLVLTIEEIKPVRSHPGKIICIPSAALAQVCNMDLSKYFQQ